MTKRGMVDKPKTQREIESRAADEYERTYMESQERSDNAQHDLSREKMNPELSESATAVGDKEVNSRESKKRSGASG